MNARATTRRAPRDGASRGPSLDHAGRRQLEDDLFSLNLHVIRCVNADPYRVPIDLHNRDAYIVRDTKTLAELPAQN
jgi:hypothetical protein